MPTLPPYSTFRTDSKQMMFPQATSHGNILTFTPPGFTQSLNVKFPDSRLAVCEKCKKNFKTRDMCRVRNVHTSAPWTTAYICITVDESCTGEDGRYVDKPLTVRMVQWQPFCVKKPFDSKTPVCSACKRTNRTRSFCRERHKHRHLPWCTVYVLLSALDSTDPNTVVAGASKKVEEEEREDVENQEEAPNGETKVKLEPAKGPEEASETGSETIGSEADGESDDINDVASSRTFLAKVSCRGTTIHWLELAEYDSNADPSYVPPPPVEAPPTYVATGIPPGGDQYYAHAMGYAAQQHQNALKSHQQYFFQMQQRQQQQYAPPPPPQWQYNMGQPGDVSQMGVAAGEVAASPPKQGTPQDSYQQLQQHQQQWALYYGQPTFATDGSIPPGMPVAEIQYPDLHQADSTSDPAGEEGESKRQRVI